MGQSLEVLGSCDGGCHQADLRNASKRKNGCTTWEDEPSVNCQALEDGFKSAVANANRGGARVSDAVLLNHELLQHARQGNVKGLSAALEKGAWTETRRPLVMKPQKPEAGGAGGKGPPSKDKCVEQAEVGMTALMFSSQTGSAECVRRLLWSGADVNAVEEDGWSSLHFAAKEGHYEVCAALLQGKANPQLVNGDDKTPVQLAVEEDDCGGFAEKLRRLVEGKVTKSRERELEEDDDKEKRAN